MLKEKKKKDGSMSNGHRNKLQSAPIPKDGKKSEQ